MLDEGVVFFVVGVDAVVEGDVFGVVGEVWVGWGVPVSMEVVRTDRMP